LSDSVGLAAGFFVTGGIGLLGTILSALLLRDRDFGVAAKPAATA